MVATPGGINGRGRARRGSGAAVAIVGEKFCRSSEERQLTVQKTSLFYPGDGFAVYEHHRRCCHSEITPPDQDQKQGGGGKADGTGEAIGELVFRVDSYGPDRHHHHAIGARGATRDELILMGPEGDCILTVRRKWPSLHQRSEGFLGEKTEGQKPLFSVRRDSVIGRFAGICVEVYGGQLGGGGGIGGGTTGPTGHDLQYRVEGSFPQRCCAVYEVWTDGEVEEEEPKGEEGEEGGGAEAAVAEIRRKVVPATAGAGAVAEASEGGVVVLGRDVFCLRLAPGFDAAFAMGLVLVLDRMTGDGSSSSSSDGRDEELPPGQHPTPAAEEACYVTNHSPSGWSLLGR